MRRTLIVFGGSGFIGKALCEEALKRNFSVISISKHGKPHVEKSWMAHPSMTWYAIDIFKDNSWKKLLSTETLCINLIGILFENKQKGLTYDKMIITANHLISSEAEKKNCPYLFLSAKGGPRGYITAKKKAEDDLFSKRNPTIIIRSGIVTSKTRPLTYAQGLLIKIGSHIPVINSVATAIYPTPLIVLIQTILNEMSDPSHKLITDIR